jgi:hypothetical protein
MQNPGTVLRACSFKGQPSATVTTDWRDWIRELARELLLGGKKSLVEQTVAVKYEYKSTSDMRPKTPETWFLK